MSIFHLAFPVQDLESTRDFYINVLGCSQGRDAPKWIDFNFFGHQISAHLRPEECHSISTNGVDGDAIPVRHFGIVLKWNIWLALQQKLIQQNYPFLLAPKIRFQGLAGEQGTFFIKDPSGNCLEFKTFRDFTNLFATD